MMEIRDGLYAIGNPIQFSCVIRRVDRYYSNNPAAVLHKWYYQRAAFDLKTQGLFTLINLLLAFLL